MSDEHEHDDHEHGHTSMAGYFGVFFALMFFTVLTWWTAKHATFGPNGEGDIYVALLIAFTKAGLVLYFFMHLRESPLIIKAVGVMGFVFFAILMLFFVTDVRSRPDVREGAWPSQAEATYKELGITPLPHMVEHGHAGGHGAAGH